MLFRKEECADEDYHKPTDALEIMLGSDEESDGNKNNRPGQQPVWQDEEVEFIQQDQCAHRDDDDADQFSVIPQSAMVFLLGCRVHLIEIIPEITRKKP